jgi:hypothetical protein
LWYKMTPAVVVSIFAGGGTSVPGTDGWRPRRFWTPYGIVADASGNVYIDDTEWDSGGAGYSAHHLAPAEQPCRFRRQRRRACHAECGRAGFRAGLAFAVSATTASGGNWLSAGAASGNTPDLLSITADPSNLAPGSYTGTITIIPAAATPAALTLAVTFTVGAALPPQLSVDQPNLSFTYPAGAPARSETLKISNAGGGALAFTVSAMTQTGGSWLVGHSGRRKRFPGTPVTLTVTANPVESADWGLHRVDSIQSNGGGTITVPVNLAISSLAQALAAHADRHEFHGVAQGGVVPPQSFGVVNLGTGSLGWTASAIHAVRRQLAQRHSGQRIERCFSAAPQVAVSVNPNGLAAGDYYGLVRIDAPGAANTPQLVTVFLTVLPAGSDPGASVQPAELFFTATPGAESGVAGGSCLQHRRGRADILYGPPPVAVRHHVYSPDGDAQSKPAGARSDAAVWHFCGGVFHGSCELPVCRRASADGESSRHCRGGFIGSRR